MYYFMLTLIILGIVTFGFITGYIIRLIVDYVGERAIEREDAEIDAII